MLREKIAAALRSKNSAQVRAGLWGSDPPQHAPAPSLEKQMGTPLARVSFCMQPGYRLHDC